MKRVYSIPTLLIEQFETSDIITASSQATLVYQDETEKYQGLVSYDVTNMNLD